MSTGFSFGTPSGPATGFGLGGTGTPAATAATGIGFGAQTAAPGGFSFGTTAKTTTAAPSFSLGAAATPATGFSFGVKPTTATPASGFTLGSLAAQPITGLGGIGAAATQPNTGLTFGALGTTATAPTSGFIGLNLTKTAALPTLGSLTAAPTGLGLFGATGAASVAAGAASIFNTATTPAASVGLGGVDPTICVAGGSSGLTTKTSDGKALKETHIPDALMQTVEEFKKYVKEQKTVSDGMHRISKNMMQKAQEDISSLKQVLAVVSNGLQRNVCAVQKLKLEMTQEIKNTEMALRTKDISPSLQYENTAPTEYFERVAQGFENSMLTYRQQIESLENHLTSLHEPTRHSPADLIVLMKKLHETFIALAAQLQQVNEAVKVQKEHYLNYVKIYHGETKDIFERVKKTVPTLTRAVPLLDHTGPTSFPGMNNAAAVAMARVMQRPQPLHGAPPVAGLTSSTLGSYGILDSSSNAGTLFGGLSAPIGLTGSTLAGIGTPQSGLSLGATPSVFGVDTSTGGDKPFQLQKPPCGSKRGKR